MVNFLSLVTVFILSALALADGGHHALGNSGGEVHRRAADLYNAAAAKYNGTVIPGNQTHPYNVTHRCRPRHSSSSLLHHPKTTSTTTSHKTETTSKAPENVGGNPHTTSSTFRVTPVPQKSTSEHHDAAPPTTTHHTTTTEHKAAPTTTKAKPPTTTKPATNNGGGGGGVTSGTHSGQGTWYDVGLGACGQTNNDNQLVAAASHILYDGFPGATANPNDNPICGRTATAHYQGKSVTFTFVDRCVGCAEFDVDFSPAAFEKLADLGAGRIDITWAFD